MKISIDIDCTPEEARRFLGLPDVTAVQEALMAEIHKRMMAAMESADAEAIMKAWVPLGVQGLEAFQKMLWPKVAARTGEGGGTARPKTGTKSAGEEAS